VITLRCIGHDGGGGGEDMFFDGENNTHLAPQ